jgi:hypothetical protein
MNYLILSDRIFMKKIVLTFLILLSASFFAYAQNVEVKGVGTIQYEGGMFSNDPSDSDKKNVLESAKVSAWKNYVAAASGAKQKMLMNNVGANAASIEKFITGYQVIDQKVDPNLKTYTVLVRVGFNSGLVDQFLESETVGSAPSSSSASRSKDSLFSFLFMSRKATSIRQFDARKTQIQEASTSASTDDNGGVTARSTKTTGGSTMRKEDDVSYAVTSSQDMDSAMGEVLNTANIEYAGYDDIVANCRAPAVSQFKNEFVSNDELAPQTRSRIINAARECGVKYFAYGTLDVGVSDVDTVTGNRRVFVSARSQLWDISKALPRKIGSVGPVQYSGLGPDQSVASRNALQNAAKETARSLVDQLNAKGIR